VQERQYTGTKQHKSEAYAAECKRSTCGQSEEGHCQAPHNGCASKTKNAPAAEKYRIRISGLEETEPRDGHQPGSSPRHATQEG
jgi:hypothetical protein